MTATTNAAFLAPTDWSSGWSRSAGTTTYQEWDRFASVAGPNDPNSPGVPNGAFVTAAPYNPNAIGSVKANTYDATAAGDFAFLTSGKNIYSPSAATHIVTNVPDYNLGGSYLTTVVLQLFTLGAEADYASVKVNGVAPTSASYLSRVVTPSPFGDSVEAETWFSFQLPGSTPTLSLTYNASGGSMSLDKVSVDSITTPVVAGYPVVVSPGFAVPEPASAALLVAAGTGLLARRRRTTAVPGAPV